MVNRQQWPKGNTLFFGNWATRGPRTEMPSLFGAARPPRGIPLGQVQGWCDTEMPSLFCARQLRGIPLGPVLG
ncbi:MAG: hypothetical protein ACREOZ_04485 [Gloeomargaritales cyanobacterium]